MITNEVNRNNTVESLIFVGDLISWISWVDSSTKSNPHEFNLGDQAFHFQKSKSTNLCPHEIAILVKTTKIEPNEN